MAIKLFISYANEDKEYKDELIKHLKALQRNKLVESWDDQQITVGQEWDKEIKKALKEAKIVVFLISADFVNSDYIHNVEIKSALERYKAGEQIIIPIIIRAYDFTSLELNRFQALPSKAKAVTSWDNQDEAWTDVSRGIKKKIYELKGLEWPPDEEGGTSVSTPLLSSTTEQNQQPKIADHHQYTCDRIEQDKSFSNFILSSKEKRQQKVKIIHEKLNFFFIYGENKQEAFGLYKRFYNRLNGKHKDFKENYKPSSITVEDNGKFQYPKYPDEETLKMNMLSEFFQSLYIDDHLAEPVLEKNLAFAIENSPNLTHLEAMDKCCFFIQISDRKWNKEITPKITRWFIEEFCAKALPKTAPHCYFFFSVDYREKKAYIQEEIEEVLGKAEYTIKLPPLGMVNYDDIEDWLDTYQDVWEEEIDTLMKKHFKEEKEEEQEQEMYMKDVQFTLKTIIDETNSPQEKRAHRGRGNY